MWPPNGGCGGRDENDNFQLGAGSAAGSTAARYEGVWESLLMDVEKRKVGWVERREAEGSFRCVWMWGEAVIRRLKGEPPASSPPAEPNLSRDCIMPFRRAGSSQTLVYEGWVIRDYIMWTTHLHCGPVRKLRLDL